VSLLGVLPALLCDAPTLSSGRCCELNSPTVGAILVVFGGDPFVEIVCEKTMVVNKLSIQLVISRMKWSIVGNIECSSDLRRNEGLLNPSYLSRSVVFQCTPDPMNSGCEKKFIITQILPSFVVCSNSNTRIVDRRSPLVGLRP